LTVGLLVALTTGCADDQQQRERVSVVVPATGDVVAVPFEVTIDSSVPLGPQDQGLHHVHIWFGDDETAQTIGEGEVVQIHNAPDGEHEMRVSLRHADHTPVGAETSVRIVISGAPTG
jgi:hypothetical protein